MNIRDARPDDAPAIAEIYAPFVLETAVSFEETPPGANEIARRMAIIQERHPYLVAEADRTILGYAYGSPYRPRPAYRHTAEVTAYSRPEARGRGIGQALYRELMPRLAASGFALAIAIITLPNDASVRFHERMGFAKAGTLAGVGTKFGTRHDTGFWQLDLTTGAAHG